MKLSNTKRHSFKTPIAPKKPFIIEKHGDKRDDPYFWLRNKDLPETLAYLKEENNYYQKSMLPLKPLANKIAKEMRSRIKEEDQSLPATKGPWEYFRQVKKGKQYPLFLRRKKGTKINELLLDQNQLAKSKKYCDLKGFAISPNQNQLAYGLDYDGSEQYEIHFKNLTTNKVLKDKIPQSSGSFVFASDNETLFYVKLDSNLRPYQVWKHKLGEKNTQDILIYEEKNAEYFVNLTLSASSNFIFINSFGKITHEVWYLDAHNPTKKPLCFLPREEGHEYEVDHSQDFFWIKTNWNSPNYKIMKATLDEHQKNEWISYIEHSSNEFIESYSLFYDYLILETKNNGLPQVKVHNLKTKKSKYVKFSDAAYSVSLDSDNYEHQTEHIRLKYSSPIKPQSVLQLNLKTNKLVTLKEKKIKGHNSKNYTCERVWVTGHDSKKIPMVLTYKKGLKKNSNNPTYLYGYGSYGLSLPDAFSEYRDVYRLVDRGFIFAVSHIRGGSEMGKSWYEDGKFLNKKNTFQDFISSAEFLCQKKYTKPSRLVISGGSAGGMLVGTCANMRPDLFSLVIAHVPFVDVLNTMLDPTLPLTPMEYNEWGNPENKIYYDYIKSYSPYDNVEKKKYPAFYITCGLNDPRVTYWEPAKWVAKLRELKTDNNPILFKINMGAGHFGATGRYDHIQEESEVYAYIVNFFGIKK